MKTQRKKASAAAAAGFALVLTLSACNGAEPGDDSTMDDGHSQHGDADGAEEDTDTGEDDGMDEDMDEGDHSAIMPMGTGDPFADVRTAAEHMPETGATLAGGFAAALDIEGDASSEAAELRSGLTALLQEHVYLAGIAVATAYETGPDSAEFGLATDAVDANSVALSEAVGSLAGEEKGEEFLERWRDHIGYFVDYALAAAEDDDEGRDAAVADLMEYTSDAGEFFEEVSGGELPAGDVTESLNGHVETLAAAVDSLAAGDTEAFADLQMASHHVVEGAAVMSAGLAAAAELEGDTADDASELRAALTANLNEHVYVAGIAVFVAYTQGADSDAFAAAAQVVDDNAVELADAVGELAGEDQREPFLELWRDHIGYFVDYAVAVAGNDQAGADAALDDLETYRHEAGAFFEEISAGELPADAVADGLAHHVSTLGGAIDSLNEALVQGAEG